MDKYITKAILTGLLLTTILLAGCSKPTLDTSSEEALQTSLQEMGESLNEVEKKQLQATMLLVAMGNAFSGKKGPELFAQFDGYTADEILEAGKKMAEKMKE